MYFLQSVVFCLFSSPLYDLSAYNPGPAGHPAHAARPGRCRHGAAGLRSPTVEG